jgi:hypothetical protein
MALMLLAALPLMAQAQTRQPVIAKVRIVFSMVSHHNHLGSRIAFYNQYGNPVGNLNYAVPHLVYEPVITLYNPYNETLTVNHARIRISDPPVGFAFRKNEHPLRPEFAQGSFLGLARFQLANESNATARKTFTLFLRSPDISGAPGGAIVLQPGESRDFSAWVETNWSWGLENSAGFSSRSFFDYDFSRDLTNKDGRTSNQMGVETVSSAFPGYWDVRAGFQTDSLSLGNGRPVATRYDFEVANNMGGSHVVTKLTDTVTVQAKAMRTVSVQSASDFQVDLLRGVSVTPSTDLLRSYPMSITHIIQNEESPVVTQTYPVGELLQQASDLTPGGKKPFAELTMIAKTRALQRNAFYQTPAVPSAQLYEMRFDAVSLANPNSPPTTDWPRERPEVSSVVRSGDTLFVDFAGNPAHLSWKVKGTSSLENGFNDDLTSGSQIVPGPPGSGIHKAIINVEGRGDSYFVRIEK